MMTQVLTKFSHLVAQPPEAPQQRRAALLRVAFVVTLLLLVGTTTLFLLKPGLFQRVLTKVSYVEHDLIYRYSTLAQTKAVTATNTMQQRSPASSQQTAV
jgi:hypothetical protein